MQATSRPTAVALHVLTTTTHQATSTPGRGGSVLGFVVLALLVVGSYLIVRANRRRRGR